MSISDIEEAIERAASPPLSQRQLFITTQDGALPSPAPNATDVTNNMIGRASRCPTETYLLHRERLRSQLFPLELAMQEECAASESGFTAHLFITSVVTGACISSPTDPGLLIM